jgi:hypothetical protein
MLEAAGKPWWMAFVALVEQVVRIGGSFVLIPLWGTPGLLIAWIAGLLLRTVLARVIAGHVFIQVRAYVWQTLLAPAASAMILYQFLRLAVAAWQPATWVAVGFTSLCALLLCLLFYSFLSAFLGGWDDGELADLRQATHLSSIGLPFAWLLLQCVAIGARISPLHNRFPIGLHDWAQQEANALTLAQTQPER